MAKQANGFMDDGGKFHANERDALIGDLAQALADSGLHGAYPLAAAKAIALQVDRVIPILSKLSHPANRVKP